MTQTALFKSSDVAIPIKANKTKGGKGRVIESTAMRSKSTATTQRLGHRYARCAEVVGKIHKGETIHLVSAAEWSAHDLINHLVSQTGPVDLWFTTWSISEDGLRSMLKLRDTGGITSINAVLDWRIRIRNPSAHQLARGQVDRLRVYSCHAKIYVLRNTKWGISIVSSANMTNNPRIEASVITEDPKIAGWHSNWISQVIDGSAPFEGDDGKKGE